MKLVAREEEDTSPCHMRRRIHVFLEDIVLWRLALSYEEEDTCMSYEEEDTSFLEDLVL